MTIQPTDFAWDFFLAHPRADTDAAKKLYGLLSPPARVFLDVACLQPGDPWDVVLPHEQARSFITVVLISEHTDAAWYERSEIAAAISLARRDGRRVVPVYLGCYPESPPYGLERLHGIVVQTEPDWTELAAKLLKLVGAAAPIVSPTTPAASPPAPAASPAPSAPQGVPVFVLVAEADQASLTMLRKHLYLAEKDKVLRLDYPGRDKTEVGREKATLLAGLDRSPVILLLVSGDLFFELDELVDRALQRHQAGARLVPLLLGDFNLGESKLKDLVALPRDQKPVSRWSDKDAAWAHIAEHVRALALSLKPH